MNIILSDDVPVYQRARRLPQVEKDEFKTEISEWLENGIIRHSNSDYASPIVLVKKRDGTERMCIDYRRLPKK